MTVSTTSARVAYEGDGSTQIFPVPYYFFAAADLAVYLTVDGDTTELTLTTHYTVSGAGEEAGGSVTILSAPADGSTVTILREPEQVQETDYQALDPFPAETHEQALDRLTMMVQHLQDQINRAFKVDVTQSGTTFPVGEADRVIKWNDDGTELENGPNAAEIESAEAYAEAAEAAAAAAEAASNAFRTVASFGAVGDGETDDYQAFEDALTWAAAQGGARIFIDAGIYRLTSGLVFPEEKGIELVGIGDARQPTNDYPVRLDFEHTDGPSIWLTEDGQSLRGICIESAGDRGTAELDNLNYGVLMARVDDVTTTLRAQRLENVAIFRQPSHGIVQCITFMTDIRGISVRECKGHGWVVDDGTILGRTNIARPGGIVARHIRTNRCQGHGWVIGNAGTFGAFRVHIVDADTDNYSQEGSTGITESIKIADVCCVLHGENITVVNCAFGGGIVGVPSYRGVQASGRVHRYIACRYITTTGIARVVEDLYETADIEFDGCLFSLDATYNPAIVIPGGDTVGNVSVVNRTGEVTNYFTSGYEDGTIFGPDDTTFPGTLRSGVIIANGASNTALRVTRADAECGLLVQRTGSGAATGQLAAAGGEIRVGSTSDSDVEVTRNSTARITVTTDTVVLASLPTSSAGLPSGGLWRDAAASNVVKIVP